MSPPPFDTHQQTPPPFPPHGRVRLDIEGRLLVAQAEGPFNLELFQMIREAAPELAQQLPQGRWGNFCEYRLSAMATPEALSVLNQMLRASAAHGGGPACTAYVIGPAVEGAGLMEVVYEKAFADAGLIFRSFADSESAKAWLRAELERLDREAPPAASQPPAAPKPEDAARPAPN